MTATDFSELIDNRYIKLLLGTIIRGVTKLQKYSWLTLLLIFIFGTVTHTALAANPRVKLETNQGNLIIELFPDKAPKTVANFLQYVNDGFYNGTIFHRVIGNFMIQGGGFTAQFERKPTRPPVVNEASNGLKNDRGTIAMARTADPHSATAQFFINVVNNDFLNFKSPAPHEIGYCVFGKVVSGMKVVDKIKAIKTGATGPFRSDVPLSPVVIKNATVVNNKK